MFAKTCFMFVCALFVFSESGFVENLPRKCSVKDSECTKDVLKTVLQDIGKSGIPDLNIPPIDPYELKNVTVNVLDMGTITMIDGVAKGAKDCIVQRYEVELEKKHAVMEMVCDITIKGKYKAHSDSPFVQTLLGGTSLHAEGTGKVVLQKLHMVFDFNFRIRERDGDFYFDTQHDELKYSHDIGKVTFAANGIMVGNNDASNVVVPLLNQNWKLVMQTVGKTFVETAMDTVYEQSSKFFQNTPAKHYLTDDLTPYVNKN